MKPAQWVTPSSLVPLLGLETRQQRFIIWLIYSGYEGCHWFMALDSWGHTWYIVHAASPWRPRDAKPSWPAHVSMLPVPVHLQETSPNWEGASRFTFMAWAAHSEVRVQSKQQIRCKCGNISQTRLHMSCPAHGKCIRSAEPCSGDYGTVCTFCYWTIPC